MEQEKFLRRLKRKPRAVPGVLKTLANRQCMPFSVSSGSAASSRFGQYWHERRARSRLCGLHHYLCDAAQFGDETLGLLVEVRFFGMAGVFVIAVVAHSEPPSLDKTRLRSGRSFTVLGFDKI